MVILSLKDPRVNQQCESDDGGPLLLNAFDLIILSQGLNLATLFDRGQVIHPNPMFYKYTNKKPCKIANILYGRTLACKL